MLAAEKLERLVSLAVTHEVETLDTTWQDFFFY
jgi:hypothetical protein